ncbi:cupin domain-containing protein [Phreatobacter aquaticus]|uniref:Cupin domain-containing protein n=1 Tax=Phreatobacter aquaticus TaxID=2570229 RepID=A0A4D7QG84_9HYPH|nr:cupin domain-containing protein [Phreatobacter aquaticus]QCK84446.1 cupin domain-containing protein [Phreatobacter aquaticus]
MISRRIFASCAICAVTGFAATEVSAQGAPPAAATGITRKVLSQTDGPAPGYVTIIAEVEIAPGVVAGRHTHPGIETGYVLEGSFDLPIAGRPTVTLKPGDAFQVPPETAHAGGPASPSKIRLISTFVVEKAKPLATPA